MPHSVMSSGDAQKSLKNGPRYGDAQSEKDSPPAEFRAISEALGPKARAGSAPASGRLGFCWDLRWQVAVRTPGPSRPK
jgi:hypothetical protein